MGILAHTLLHKFLYQTGYLPKGLISHMNDHKFAFIICTNNTLLLDECLHYIDHLIVPEGYEAELLTIPDAPCMTQGYNEAMQTSDARYKIYMHQDVFILNQNILGDLLAIFASDPQIGLVGMVGYEKVAADGIMWHTDRTGSIYMRHPQTPYPALSDYRYNITDGFEYVAEIDGFFMATCHDLPWDTDKLDGWDFYDAFQSIRFLLEGYKIAVPCQRHPWCMHDDNGILNLVNYDRYRKIFLQTYPQFLGKTYADFPLQRK